MEPVPRSPTPLLEPPPASGPAGSPRAREPEAHRSVGKGTIILVLGTTLLFLFGFLSRVLLARGYSTTDWGAFSLGFALSGFLSVVALFGLDQGLARTLAFEHRPQVRRAIVRHGIAVATLAAIGSTALVYFLSAPIADLFHLGGMQWVIQLFSFTVGIGVLSLALAAVFQGFEDAFPNALFNQIVNPGLFVLFLVLALLAHWSFETAVVGYVAAEALALVGLIGYTVRRLRSAEALPPAPVPLKQLWKVSGALWGVGTLAYVTAYVDTLILGAFRPVSEVGAYAALMTLGRILLISNGALTYIYLPVAARLARQGEVATIRSTYLAGTRWVLLIVAPGALLLFLLPAQALTIVFGAPYAGGAPVLQLLVVPAFLAVLVGPANACLAGLGRFRALLGTTTAAAVTNLAVSFGLIPFFGLWGAALAWGIARAMYPGLGWAILYRDYRVNPFARSLSRPLAVALPAIALLYLGVGALHPPLWSVVPLYGAGVLVYLAALLATRSVVPGDLALLKFAEQILRRPLPGWRALLVRCGAGPSGGAPPAARV